MCCCVCSRREGGSTLAADIWLLRARLGGVGVFVAPARSLWRGVRRSAFGRQNKTTAAQQGAAPDRPQCCRFSSLPARLKVGRDWRAAGELSRWAFAFLRDGFAEKQTRNFDALHHSTRVGKYGRIRPYSFVHDSFALLLACRSSWYLAIAPFVWSLLSTKLGTISLPAQIRCVLSKSPCAKLRRSNRCLLRRGSNASRSKSGSTPDLSFGV